MNIIMPTIPNVYLKNSSQSQMQTNNYSVAPTYSFSKLGPNSTLSGNTSLDNSAISIINAYFSTLNNTTKKENMKNSNNNVSTSHFLISKPNFSHKCAGAGKVTISFFYYTASNSKNSFTNEITDGTFRKNFAEISTTLAQLYQKEVNIVVTRLYYPYLNSDILSQYLAYNAPSNTFMDFQEAILTNPSLHKTNLPAHISGIKVQVSGRLVTETVIPRITVKSCLIGTFQRSLNNNTASSIDYSKFTTKNELGAFTVKVWICQQSLLK